MRENESQPKEELKRQVFLDDLNGLYEEELKLETRLRDKNKISYNQTIANDSFINSTREEGEKLF